MSAITRSNTYYPNFFPFSYSQNAGMSVDEWICTWIRPLLKANLTSMTSLVRILKTGLKINQNAVLDEVGKMSKSNMTLAMVCFKLDRQKGEKIFHVKLKFIILLEKYNQSYS